MKILEYNKMRNRPGFTLIEMAIILVVLGLLIGMTLPLLSQMAKHRHYQSTQKQMEEIKEALIGYGGIHGRLPFADTTIPPDGIGDNNQFTGTLPYAELGLGAVDAWRNSFTYDVNNSLASLAGGDKAAFCTALASLSGDPQLQQGAVTVSLAALVISKGENSALDGENADADRIYLSQNPTDTFDDLVAALNHNVLYGQLDCASSGGSGSSCPSYTVLNRQNPRIYIQGGAYPSCTQVNNNQTFTLGQTDTIIIYSSAGCVGSGTSITSVHAQAADTDGDCNVRWNGTALIDD
ncbi:MAG: prepilin-type N-terminal cleavage/methylation domain-containing protein [Deltaproteobacteria bacterium]|nr:prepilin-type N-terminal cleavage/methylation domain-containing protein [Deltaproteobacteria bacterium]